MRLFELVDQDSLAIKIDVLVQQLEQDYKEGKINDDFTLDDLIRYFSDNEVVLGKEDLYNMIKVPPMNDLVKNIQGDKVVFAGQEEEHADRPEDGGDNEKTVKQMAKRAMKI
jgi:hypothetical protein